MPGTLTIGVLIHRNSVWLGAALVDLADEALSAHEDGKYPLAVIKSGAFLEGILVRLLDEWGISTDAQVTLGPLIGALRKSERVPKELLERLNEANTIRNRAAHNKPLRLSQVTEGDSLLIVNILGLVVQWYGEHLQKDLETSPVSDMLPIFLSVGTAHRLDQEQFIQRLRSEMRGIGVELRSLLTGEYSKNKPFQEAFKLIHSCRAALIVGLDRSHAYAVFEREKSDYEKLYQDQYITTAWNQIEGSMASGLGLPLLVLREKRLHKEGVFEAANHGHRIRDFDLRAESRGLSPDLRAFLSGWVEDVRSTERTLPEFLDTALAKI